MLKRTGLLILVFGLLITLITGFNYVTNEKNIEIGELNLPADKRTRASWLPMIGIVVMVVGGVIFVAGGKEK
jgi:TRAP-type C4-dicarboxylate transport system permease small subunit